MRLSPPPSNYRLLTAQIHQILMKLMKYLSFADLNKKNCIFPAQGLNKGCR